MTPSVHQKVGALLAAAISAGYVYYAIVFDQTGAQSLQAASSHSHDTPLASRSPAYLFGFANAALVGCQFKPGDGLDQLAAAVESDQEGVVPDELKAGFAEFSALQQARGTAGACNVAERLLGPHAQTRPGVLQPR